MSRVCFILVFAFICGIHGAPHVKSGVTICFQQKCPEDTFGCEKIVKISEDKKSILTEIHCLGLKGKILSNKTTSVPNPFGSLYFFQGYSFQGSLIFTGDDENDNPKINIDVTNEFDNTSDVEEITSKEQEKLRPDRREYSEVDDLNIY
ncbi:unnamed protein product [Phyllotreta striolata]|uniref:Uncharacterized protein n=1 Tax=Phyllotreta striolata TaxID=444603 RepID=A0A9N9TGE0_PHYSR|nr:unnamed protein product [Phyllotreta striolata]